MKSLKEYIVENFEEKKYSFKIKVAGELPENFEDCMKSALNKFDVSKFSKVKTTPIQPKLLDFPDVENSQVTIWETELNYPTTSAVLRNYLAAETGINETHIRVRSPAEEAENELNAEHFEDKKKEALLNQDYEKSNNQGEVGQKKISSLLKDLAKMSKESAPTQYKGVNDQLLGKTSKGKQNIQTTEDQKSMSPIGSRQNKLPEAGKGTSK
jgi:hypothetical protein